MTEQKIKPAFFCIGIYLAYSIVYLTIFPAVGHSASILGLIPMVFTAWLMGKPGVLPALGAYFLLESLFILTISGFPRPQSLLGYLSAVGVTCLIGYATDVLREVKRVNHVLAISEARFRTIFDRSPTAKIIYDEEGQAILFNPAFESLFHWTATELSQTKPSQLFQVASHTYNLFNDFTALRNALPFKQEARCCRKPAAEFWGLVLASNIPLIGDTTGILIQVIDITEKKKQESLQKEQLRQESQAQRLESIGVLAAGVAHEINTPLQYVQDNLEFLETAYLTYHKIGEMADKLTTPDDARNSERTWDPEYLDFIQEEVPEALRQSQAGMRQVSKIVRTLKRFSHMETYQEKVDAQLNQIIADALMISRNQWKDHVEVETDLDPDLPMIHCYLGDFEQVMLNLIINAAQAIKEKHTRSDSLENGRLIITTNHDAQSIMISVSDTGMGISPEIRRRIFDPFFTTKSVSEGSGQGLSFVHSAIVDRLNGVIEVASEQGAGTTFTISIPFTPTPSS